jgi:hypothetical protein
MEQGCVSWIGNQYVYANWQSCGQQGFCPRPDCGGEGATATQSFTLLWYLSLFPHTAKEIVLTEYIAQGAGLSTLLALLTKLHTVEPFAAGR